MTTDVLSFGKDMIGVLLPVLTFILGKATKGGANQTLLDQACTEIKSLRSTIEQHALALSSHTTLHTGYVAANVRVEGRLDEMNRMLGKLCGKMDID